MLTRVFSGDGKTGDEIPLTVDEAVSVLRDKE
jgi:hypothetical protein